MNKELELVDQELKQSFESLKAEIFVAEILEKSSLDFSDIDIHNISTFSRSYRRDIVNFGIDTTLKDKDKLKLSLARNGLYDALPEGLFHNKQKSTGKQYKEISQRNKKEEKAARKFFTPLENEFFTQKVKVEQNKRELINKFADLRNSFLVDFWGLDKDCPEELNLKMLKVLPFAYKISGKISSIEVCLAHILGEKVSIIHKFKSIKNTREVNTIEDLRLGVDFTLNNQESMIQYPVYEIEIGPLSNEEANSYLPEGGKMKFINNFSEYFVPVDVEVEIKIIQKKKEEKFTFEGETPSRLGLTTVI